MTLMELAENTSEDQKKGKMKKQTATIVLAVFHSFFK
jgi:hypothetical protein